MISPTDISLSVKALCSDAETKSHKDEQQVAYDLGGIQITPISENDHSLAIFENKSPRLTFDKI